jgi:lysophospholipase L1-like esterase
MAALLILLAILAAVVGGAVALFTIGTIGAVVVVVLVLALAAYGIYAKGPMLRAAAGVSALVFVGALAFGGFSAFQAFSALTGFDGPTDPPDAAALASAEAKLDAAERQAGFRVELTEQELTAVLQDTLADATDNPIRRVDITIVDGSGGSQGTIEFTATFKRGSLTGSGRVGATLDAGAIVLDVQDVSLGNLTLPGLATGAMEDLVDTILDLNTRLADYQADVQSLTIGGGRVLVTGTQGTGALLTASALLGALAENAEAVGSAVTPPDEVIGPGSVNAVSADGPSYIVALGDSLAANVGVPSPSGGYVSRFHKVASQRDSTNYGLRNFGVSGETSGTLIRSGQLAAAETFIRANTVAYVTLDIGANDLLGHLGSDDCAQSIADAACQERLGPALTAYRANLSTIFERLRTATGEGTPILFLTSYNPFSLGLGTLGLEQASDDATQQLNAVVAEIAASFGVRVADGFTPMRGTTAATTHMLQSPPDVHPNSAGYDLLAQALSSALP